METSVDQKSATVLSMWHCVFAVSANRDDKKEMLKAENAEAMQDIYRQMKDLRLATQKTDKSCSSMISQLALPFNLIFSGKMEEKWIQELCSMMRELVIMRDELQENKGRLYNIDIYNPTTLLHGNEPKDIITLLTIWYWLASWYSGDQLGNHGPKDEFIQAIEAQADMLGNFLFKTTSFNQGELEHLQQLFSMLLQMVKSDHQLWMDVLNQFLYAMALESGVSKTPKLPVVPLSTPFSNADNYSIVAPIVAAVGSAALLGAVGALAGALTKSGYEEVMENKKEILAKLKEMGHDVENFTAEEYNEFVDKLKDLGITMGDGIIKWSNEARHEFDKAMGEIGRGASQAIDKMKDAANDAAKEAGKLANDALDGLKKGAKAIGSLFGIC